MEPAQEEVSEEGDRGLLALQPGPARDLAEELAFVLDESISPAVSESPAPLFWAQRTRRHSAVPAGHQWGGRAQYFVHWTAPFTESYIIITRNNGLFFFNLVLHLRLQVVVETQSGRHSITIFGMWRN